MGLPNDITPATEASEWLNVAAFAEEAALCIAWDIAEPGRLGEVALLSGPGPWTLGRGEGPGRLHFTRQRPGWSDPRPPLASPRMSREQLRFEREDGTLCVHNVGRRDLLVNGRPTKTRTLVPGDTVHVARQLVLQVVLRPAVLPPTTAWTDDGFAFGHADRYGIVGESPAAWALREILAFAAPRPAHVLLHGESGTGKELAARALHAMSPRADKPFIGRSAVTLHESLIDAELFGNRRNYPNPGMPERAGLVGAADGSTLFLDEIGELPEQLQAHLLRVLDTGEYTRLGEAEARQADLRLVAATNRPVDELKHDLAARLEIRIAVAGLGQRKEDVPLLVDHLLGELAAEDPWIADRFFERGEAGTYPRIDPALVERLLHHDYTHHARELRAVLWRAMSESRDSYVPLTPSVDASLTARSRDPAELTADEIRAALERNDGNRSATWKALGLRSRDQLYRLMRKLGVED